MLSAFEKTKDVNIVSIREADDASLERISREGLLSLTLDEMKAVQGYFRTIGRDPSDVELETIAQTWSEHCFHKTFRAKFTYRESAAGAPAPRVFENLLKDTIMAATKSIAAPWCLSVFKDNAGVIQFDDTHAVSFKVETHNHPSALEPYGGAGTGVGGVIRDVMGCGLGGKPVLNTDVFCFGDLNTPASDLPDGALPPKQIARGVVAGVRDYGNRMGIPTANGAIYFDPGYVGNPLVFCGTVGFMPANTVEKSVKPGDLVVVAGGRTGRDGIHGATFSSAPLTSGITSNVVQIGHAIMEKKVLDVLLTARDKNLYRSVTDCGAGGFSSAVGELGSETGVRVYLDRAPLKYPGLAPWEIWVSESQERMVFSVPPDRWAALKNLFDQEDVEAVVIGEFTADRRLVVMHGTYVVADLEMDFLHNGNPKWQLDAVWDPGSHRARHAAPVSASAGVARTDFLGTLATLLRHPVIASKQTVVRQYDHEVQGGSVIKPFMGPGQDGPTDACVFRPKLDKWRGVAVSNGLNPEIGKFDPYAMALIAVDEAYRNLIAVGGGLIRAAILDNFCWGDAKSPEELGGLVRAAEGCRDAALAYQLPFISGKDSFNNTWRTADGQLHSIPPTLLVSAIGVLDDVRHCLSAGFKEPDRLVYMVGETRGELLGSLASRLWNLSEGELPSVDFTAAKTSYKKLQSAMKSGLVKSCHDVSEGGIAVAAAEMAFGGTVGVELNADALALDPEIFLFSETPSRFLVEIDSSDKTMFEQTMGPKAAVLIGKTTKKPQFVVRRAGEPVIQESIDQLKRLWTSTLANL